MTDETKDDLTLSALPDSDAPQKEKWARGPLMIAVAIPLLFVLLGIAFMGFAVFKEHQTQNVPTPASAVMATSAAPDTRPDTRDEQIARLEAELNALRANQGAATPDNSPRAFADTGSYGNASFNSLSARLDRLEANQRLMVQAAAAATAASGLQQAAKGSQPFLSELADVEKSLTDTSLIAPLRPLAQKGVTSEVTLAVEFPTYAARAQAVSRPEADDGFLTRLGNMFSRLFTIRNIDPTTAKGTDAVLIHAQARIDEGDLPGAIAHLKTLPQSAQDALKPWLERAEQRAQVDHLTRRVAIEALSRLSQVNYSTATSAPTASPTTPPTAPESSL
ncbi:MAG: hypothetical protein QM645_11025 [Asticcacaulis sp.]